jgi:hypothetical protein
MPGEYRAMDPQQRRGQQAVRMRTSCSRRRQRPEVCLAPGAFDAAKHFLMQAIGQVVDVSICEMS